VNGSNLPGAGNVAFPFTLPESRRARNWHRQRFFEDAADRRESVATAVAVLAEEFRGP
jgi:hypothetical protein